MNRITYDMLQQAGACQSALDTFRQLFPTGAPVSMRSARRALEAGLDIDFVREFLSPEARKAYSEAKSRALKAYYEATAPARRAFQEAKDQALKTYYDELITYYAEKAHYDVLSCITPAWHTLNKAKAQAQEAFDEATNQAQKIYNEATAQALVNALRRTQ